MIKLLLLTTTLATGQLSISGEGLKTIEVERHIIIKEKRTVVASFPIEVKCEPKDNANYYWTYPYNAQVVPDANTLKIINAPQGEIYVTVNVDIVDFVAKKRTIETYTTKINVGVPDPVPSPPDPVPPPPDPVPEKFGFITLAKQNIPQGGSKAKAPALADNFEAIAAKIAAGAITTPDQANAELRIKNQETLPVGQVRTDWTPFFQAWAVKAKTLNDSGKMTTVEDYKDAYNETAAGLRALNKVSANINRGFLLCSRISRNGSPVASSRPVQPITSTLQISYRSPRLSSA